MSFHWPHVFWLLLLPVGLSLFDFARRRRAAQIPHPKILRAVADADHLELASGSASRPRSVRFRWRLWAGLILAVTALARPQWGRLEEPTFDQAREILIAVDLSRSMLAQDVKPSRLDRAKLLITSLLERLEGERVGLVVFAGTAFLQSPLSADYEILREFLPELTPTYLPEGGSNYAAMLDTAVTAFSSTQSADRYLIILSDGESTTEEWQQRIAKLNDLGVRVLSLGIGTAGGSMIPDAAGGFVKDERGAVVLSRLGSSTLQELAQKTNGAYTDASTWVDLAQLISNTVEQGKRGEFAELKQIRLADRFQWALAPAVLLLLWSFWREFPVAPKARDLRLATGPAHTPSASTPMPSTPTPRRAVATTTTAALLLLGLALGPASRAPAAVPLQTQIGNGATPPADLANALAGPLSKLVAQLSTRDTLTAKDYDELARTTLTYGQRLQSSAQPVPQGPVLDALSAVDLGEKLDSVTLTEWAWLRLKLEELLEHKQDEQEKQDQEQQGKDEGQPSDEQKQENPQGGKQDEQKKQNKPDGQQQQPNGEGPEEEQQNPEQDQQKQGNSAFGDMQQPPPPPQPQGDMQKVGGEPEPKNEESQAPELAVPLQKLDQLRNQDSPAKLHQLMQDPNAKGKAQKGRDW